MNYSKPIPKKLFQLTLFTTLLIFAQLLITYLNISICYPTVALKNSFLPTDGVNLILLIPLFLFTLWISNKKILPGIYFWLAAEFYTIYVYLPYIIATPKGLLTIHYILIVCISCYTLIELLRYTQAITYSDLLLHKLPLRKSASVLIALAVLIILTQASHIFTAYTESSPVDLITLSVWIDDFLIAIPALLITGFLLFQRKSIGVITGTAMLFAYGTLSLGLIPYFIFQAFTQKTPVDIASICVMLFMAIICYIPFYIILRQSSKSL